MFYKQSWLRRTKKAIAKEERRVGRKGRVDERSGRERLRLESAVAAAAVVAAVVVAAVA